MLRIYLLLAVIVLAFYLLRKFIKTPPEIISLMIKKTAIALMIGLLILLAVTGRLNWVFPVLGVLFAFSLRLLPWVARYFPQLHKLWSTLRSNKKQGSSRAGGVYNRKMTEAQAYEILGLDSTASRKQIITSHKKLIQKLHPDRGGSDYLAAQINQAKETLLKYK